MSKAKTGKRKKAFQLFDEGFEAKSPEVKALKLSPSTRYKYQSEWRTQGSSASTITPIEEGKAKVALPSGETVGGVDETKTIRILHHIRNQPQVINNPSIASGFVLKE